MQDYIAFGGPLADPSVWRGALLWAIALYVPLSGPLSAFEASLTDSPLSEKWRQITLVISSLLLALGVGVVTQLSGSGYRISACSPARPPCSTACSARRQLYDARALAMATTIQREKEGQ